MPALSPSPKFRAVGADGLALVGGKLWSYTAGTSTPKATYVSFGGAANTNPVILDARGECDLWLDGNYKLTLLDENDAQIWSVDDIRDLTSSATFTNATLAGTLTITSTAITGSGNPTLSGNWTFTNNLTVNGNTVLGNASSDTLTINPNAISYPNNPTHANNHTFSGNASVTGTLTASAVAPVFTFGATFGNTSRAGVTVLDWYEEDDGTDTATVEGTSTAGTATYSTQTLHWVRFGRWVEFRIALTWSSFTGTGNMLVKGLPYAPADSTTPCSVIAENLTFSNQLAAHVSSLNSGQIAIDQVSSAGALAAVAVDAAGSLWLSGSYRV